MCEKTEWSHLFNYEVAFCVLCYSRIHIEYVTSKFTGNMNQVLLGRENYP